MRKKSFCMALIGAVWLISSSAYALTTCNSPIVVSASTTLTLNDDYHQDGSLSLDPCFQLQNGATLDLNGHTITRDFDTGVSDAAIECLSTGTTVTDGANVKGVVKGEGWTVGILDCENVIDVTVDGGGNDGTGLGWITYGIYNPNNAADNHSNNVVLRTTQGMIITAGFIDSNSTCSNNSFADVSSPIIVTGSASSPGALVENNVIRTFGYRAITKSGTNYIRVRKNLIDSDGRDPFYDGEPCLDINATHSTVTENYCDCVDAFSAPQCPIDLPYALQWF